MSAAPSIPTSPPPGKDPPLSSPPHEEPLISKPTDQEIKTSMPPPPPPIRPTITTQPPSRSTTFQNQNQTQTSTSLHPQTSSYEEEKPRPNFTPFFTLINDISPSADGGKGETNTIHPSRVCYLFSDDDTNSLSDALVRCLPPPEPEVSPPQGLGLGLSEQERENGKQEREERVIIVDINDTGEGIKAISCLNKKWQVLGATIDNAPTWDGTNAEDATTSPNALMLKIEGVSIPPSTLSPSSSQEAGKGKGKEGEEIGEEEMQALLEGFDRKMEILRRVVGQQQDPHLHTQRVMHRREGSAGSGGSAVGS